MPVLSNPLKIILLAVLFTLIHNVIGEWNNMRISPKEFLKTRRPSQFSDSKVISESLIDSTILEYYLDTLANRSQEIEFEQFGISLCRVAITPNLIPNTGPTGGGDSKVDSETYPVSDSTTLGWFTSIDPKVNKERWAFAFSIQKDWGVKVREDIKKIYETDRGYKVAYFVSSRSIRAKDRARVEDELKKKYNIDVRILDRNWIIKEVFENKREEIVKKELHLNQITETKIKKGPLDLQREEDLEVLDKKIETTLSENKGSLSVVDDAIGSAILSRELEKPRVEIDGRFDRAERLAQEFGTLYQQFEVAYQRAWTTFWWHEDFSTYVQLYQSVEDRVIDTEHVYNLERLTNLWFGLNTLHNQGKEGKKIVVDEFFNTHTQTLKKKLQEISKEKEEKPNASLNARALLLVIELVEKKFLGQELDKTIISLKKVVEESRNLIGFPFKTLVQILTENGEILEGNPEYQTLFQTILKVTEERDSETAGAKLSLGRSEKLISLNRPYEAIKELGSALRKLYKHENKDDIVRALFLIGIAYEQVGLFWAARGALLSAASLSTSDFWNYGEINTMQAACYKRLKWLELRLGRIPQTLNWHNLDDIVRHILSSKGYDQKKLFEQINRFDMALGILFLRSDIATLKTLQYLPDVLTELDLDFSSIALIYALGLFEKIPSEFTTAIPPEKMDEFFVKWAEQYSSEYLPSVLTSTEVATTELNSKVLGCKIVVNVENQTPCIEIAESFLAAIESFLATGPLRHAVSREPIIEINVDTSGKTDLVDYAIDDEDNKPIVYIRCQKFNPHSLSRANQEKLGDIILKILSNTVGRFVIFEAGTKDIEEIVRDEKALERALNFTSSFITLGNVLGATPKTQISQFVDEKKEKYELRRTEPLHFPEAPKEVLGSKNGVEDKDPLAHAKHTDLQTISIIKDVLWNQAKWKGVGYMVMLNGEAPPIFAVLFENIEAGKKIFAGWKKRFGNKDNDEEIRITIVKGIDKNNLLHYKVGISSNSKAFEKEWGNNPSKFFAVSTRIHTMTPQSLQNLNNFEASYDRFKYFLFAPGYMGKDGLPEIIFDHGIVKKEINFREAWEIGPNDLDSPLVSPEDDPVIPAEVNNPPVIDLLKRKNKSKKTG